MDRSDRLARAKKYLAIAESKDASREAYKQAVAEVVAHKKETGDSNPEIAVKLGRVRNADDKAERSNGGKYVASLLRWHDSGYKTETPFAHGGESEHRKGSDKSATKRILREQPVEEIQEMLDDLPDEAVEKLSQATESTKVTRRLYPDQPKPTHEKATQRAKAKDTETLKASPVEASARLGSVIGSARAAVRAVVKQYQEFQALVEDEDFRADGREQVVTLRADVDLALGEVLEGSVDQALSRLLNEEVK